MSKIHPTALIAKEAKIGKDVEVGPYSVIGPNVTVGNGTRLKSHVVLDGFTEVGEHCLIYPGACLGETPQFKKFNAARSYLKIGSHNIIRESVTMHPGTTEESETRVGDRGFFMVGSHIGHDCRVGNDVVIANGCALGGHVVIEDSVMIGGLSGIHQFTRVGRLAMIGGLSKVVTDVLPFSLCDGNPATFKGHNIVGLKRAGFAVKDTMIIKKVLKTLLASKLNLSKASETVRKEYKGHKDVQAVLTFIEKSKRGLTRADFKESKED